MDDLVYNKVNWYSLVVYVNNLNCIYLFVECQYNLFGVGCLNECGYCLNGEQCDLVNGICYNGCEVGYYIIMMCEKGKKNNIIYIVVFQL